MIVCDVMLVSALGRHRDRQLGRIVISNIGTGTATRGNYVVMAGRGKPTGKPKRTYSAMVNDFPRKSRSGLELLRRALNALHKQGELP